MPNTEYYSQIIHEIKNSITLINSYLQLIERKHPEITTCDYWSSVCSETSRLRTIATEFSQLKLGSNLYLEYVDIRNIVRDCCNDFQAMCNDCNISCQLAMPAQPLMASIDIKQFRHAIINLLKNACEAMPHRGKVLVSALMETNHVCISITDYGCGIAPDIIPHIFDAFVTTKGDGSGLGLDITRRIIHAHNGSISVSSIEGEGSTFTILLPT